MSKVIISFSIVTAILMSFILGIMFVHPAYSSESVSNDTENNPSLVNPNSANAMNWFSEQAAKLALNELGTTAKFTVCDGLDDCDLNSEGFSSYVSMMTPANDLVTAICDPKNNRFDHVTIDGKQCADPVLSQVKAEEYFSGGVLPGGGASLLASSYGFVGTDISVPTDLAMFIKDTTSDTVFGTPAYAADPLEGTVFKGVVLGVWKIMRNLALTVLGVITAVAALMVIFRKKISAQAVVTVYNILPRIPIAILFILLSYPIAALLISLVAPLTGFSLDLGWEVIKSTFKEANESTPSTIFYYLVTMAINALFAIVPAMGVMNVAVMIVIAVLVIIFVVIMAVLLVHIIGAYVDMIVNVIFAPIIGVISILPGQERGVVNLILRMLVDILVVPIIIFVILVGLAIIIVPVDYFKLNMVPVMAFFAMFWVYIIKTIMGLMIMWQATKVKKMMIAAFGVTGLFETGQQRR